MNAAFVEFAKTDGISAEDWQRLGEDKVDVMLDLMLLSHCGKYPYECKTLNCIRKPIRHIFATVREQHNAEDIRAREKS